MGVQADSRSGAAAWCAAEGNKGVIPHAERKVRTTKGEGRVKKGVNTAGVFVEGRLVQVRHSMAL